AELQPDGRPGERRLIAGGREESIFQPEWSPAGDLVFVSDRTGWWNLYLWKRRGSRSVNGDPEIEALLPLAAEFGQPQWTISQSTYCFLDAHRIAATYTEQGRWHLGVLHLETRAFHRIDLPLEPTDGVRATQREAFVIGGSPTHPPCVARWVGASAARALSAPGAPEDRAPAGGAGETIPETAGDTPAP